MMSSGSGELEPLHRLRSDDRGPIVVIVAYSWIFVSSIAASIRCGIAGNQRLRFKVDDATFLLGVVFAIGSSVFFHLSTNGGLGRHISTVDEAGLDKYYTMMYGGQLTGIAAMALAKTSVVFLSDRVAPQEPRPYYIMLGLVAIWTILSIFATAFQCSLPHPWVYVPSKCPSHGNLQYPIIVLNIVTDALLATWILPTVWGLIMETGKRVTVIVLFGSRLVVCLVAIAQLVTVSRNLHKEDQTWHSFGPVVWELCVIHLSVLLSTLPRTNRFISALQATHTTALLTEYELSHPNGVQTLTRRRSISTSGGITSKSEGITEPSEAHTRSRSVSRSSQSRDPLVEMPLKLIPSLDQNFSTHISSQNANEAYDGRKHHKYPKKYSVDSWKNLARLNGRKNDEETNTSGMLTWRSSGSGPGEQIVATREVTQEVEYVWPRESRWNISRSQRQSQNVENTA
ncbi:hypothetical protein K469DRAFT_654560 [Zopfia rhizophila CBS 207.26]|uniref:Rhodopsin domain-containing protein n=1 Tax=Zopfia rhizophila CBS 207.26 TaxID=1314779 RepID=A0A6A6EME4_9PEZI|nr:hypothetical protein K469DRAFT_654560 [Zopfia rhizophila CBS 207.26]